MLHRMRLPSSISVVVGLSVALVVVLSACGTAKASAFPLTHGAPAQTVPNAGGIAPLMPQPSGEGALTWDPTTDNTLTVALSVIGLSPATPGGYHSDPYPGEIGAGTCQQPGKDLYPLKPVAADQYGAGENTTTVKGVAGGIPDKEWHLALHFPASAKQETVLVCATVLNPKPSTTEKQTVKVWLHGMPHQQGGDGAYGRAHMSLSGTTLTVALAIGGLAPDSKHAAHIHSGSCAKQGPVVYTLETVTADASGRAHVVTKIQNVKSIAGDWYINVHNGTDLTTQVGFQPISCGNVFSRD